MAKIINKNINKAVFNKPSGISISGYTKEYSTYQEMLRDTNPGKFGWVLDATGDTTVNHGAAYYRYDAIARKWTKIFEQEIMDRDGSGEQTYIGWFATAEDLTAEVPIGQNGLRAMVGSTDTIWTWDGDTNQWVNTAPGTVELTQLNQTINERAPANIPFTSANLVEGKLNVTSTKPPKGILSNTTGTYFAVAPSTVQNGTYALDLSGLIINGIWYVVF